MLKGEDSECYIESFVFCISLATHWRASQETSPYPVHHQPCHGTCAHSPSEVYQIPPCLPHRSHTRPLHMPVAQQVAAWAEGPQQPASALALASACSSLAAGKVE